MAEARDLSQRHDIPIDDMSLCKFMYRFNNYESYTSVSAQVGPSAILQRWRLCHGKTYLDGPKYSTSITAPAQTSQTTSGDFSAHLEILNVRRRERRSRNRDGERNLVTCEWFDFD